MTQLAKHSVTLTIIAVACAAYAPGARGVGFLLESDFAYFPDFDPDGSQLTHIMEAAAAHYNHILRDNWSIGLSYRYAPPGAAATIASTVIHSSTSVTLPTGGTAQRPVHASVVFSGGTSWFFDPTPSDHSEFSFDAVTYAQLSAERKNLGFVGEPPPRLEVAFEGTGHSGVVGIDALSVALHELGHVLGVSATFAQGADGDYDFNPDFLDGRQTAAMVPIGDPNHLRVHGALMDPAVAARMRTLPSAADIFAMAAATSWQQIDLPRKEFWSGDNWFSPSSWSGHRIPDLDDDAYLRPGGTVTIGPNLGDAQAGRLLVDEGTTLELDGGRLHARELRLEGGASLAQLGGSATGERLAADSTSKMLFEIGNPSRPPLAFLERADLAGTLEFTLAPGYSPAVDDTHTLLVTRQITGAFDRVNGPPDLAVPGMNVLLEISDVTLPGAEPLRTLVAQFAIEGDTNADGRVDQTDLDTVLLGWGQVVTAAHLGSGDMDGTGRVDQADLDQVLLHWGSVAPLGAASAVPEPSTLALAIFASSLGWGLIKLG